MKTKLFALVVCLVGIAACNSKDANKGIEQFLSEKTVKVSIGGVKDLKHNQIADTISSLNYDVCYVLNANCSFCFATFFHFVNELENYAADYQTATILDQGSACNLEYYVEQVALKRKVHIIENIDNEFVEGNIEEKDLNGFFFVRRNELLECYKYVGY